MVHLVYCDNKTKELDKIINGTKTMIIRGASGRKIPHRRVNLNEELYFMEKGTKKIYVKAIVKQVFNYVKLDDDEITNIINSNNDKLNLTNDQKIRWHKKCLCLVEFNNVEKIKELNFVHQNNMDDWLILNTIDDVLEETSIQYNYDNAKFNKIREVLK